MVMSSFAKGGGSVAIWGVGQNNYVLTDISVDSCKMVPLQFSVAPLLEWISMNSTSEEGQSVF